MPLGSLDITLPNGQTRAFVVEQASLGVGRDPDNELVIDDPSVSRRHARLTFEAGRLMVEDLGSSHGTFIGAQRLEANTPSLVPPAVPIRLADTQITYHPSLAGTVTQNFGEPGAATTLLSPASPSAEPPVSAALTGPGQPVAPGSTTTATLTIQNRGPVVDEFVIHLSGAPADWVRLSQDRLPLLPGAQAQVTLTFQPPRQAEVVAADHPFTVTVMSREHRTGVNVSGVIQVLPYPGLVLNLQPVRSDRDFQLVALNQGNAPASFTLTGRDDDHDLLYLFSQPAVTLAPGQTLNIGLSVTPKVAPRIGLRETRAFSVVAQPAEPGNGPEVSAAGQLVIRPPIPIWLVPLAVILLLCLCITGAFAYTTVCPDTLPNAPFCPAGTPPVINVFTATPSEIEPGDTVVIAWDVSNADKVELVLPALETVDANGLRAVNIASSTTYLLRATNAAGSVEEQVFVIVRGTQPVIESFTATPGVITAGQADRILLAWTTVGADSVTIEGVPNETFPPTGSVEVPAPSANATYTLIAASDTGTVRQDVTVVISAAECAVTNISAPDRLSVFDGPGGGYPVVVQLENGTRVDPIGRSSAGDWLKVRAAGREGWVAVNFIACTGSVNLGAYPTVDPAQIPTLAPTATHTPIPPTSTPAPSGTPPPTATLPPTATSTETLTPTPSATPVFTSGGLVTYRVQSGGRTNILLQQAAGDPITLVFDKDDAMVLDYTPHNGGRFAIWALEGGQHRIFIVSPGGQLLGGPISGGWSEITDGDWSYDGQRLVVEALTGGTPTYYFYDGSGNALGQPAMP